MVTQTQMNADEIIKFLDLSPHPEGGHYRQTWVAENAGRPTGTCIYFLLKRGENSHWHRVDAAEIWMYHSGAPIVLSMSRNDQGPAHDRLLGPDLAQQQLPQLVVPTGHWQSARTTGDWTLVSCTVSPGFQFEGFDLAGPDFDIPRD